MQTPYELLGSEAGVRRLAQVFYQVMDELPQAQTIRHMHAANLENIQQKLFEYLSGWLGGPHHYQQKYGTVCLTKPHQPYAIGPAERDQWLLCMEEALRRVNASAELQAMLKDPMYRIADALRTSDGHSCPGKKTAAGCDH